MDQVGLESSICSQVIWYLKCNTLVELKRLDINRAKWKSIMSNQTNLLEKHNMSTVFSFNVASYAVHNW